ncbi:MAG: hypothetical protein D6687_06660 [Acidobacteria bacterium]|jgi:hypothetical protein|nr:MAG: hypothetical protein D6687_06660 [Acidobacteriota bacterium]GIU82526.1 MAG: hypothetical protein KatS3mg006_1590 [Pyrinomonadaceae bacterium]
MNSGYILGIVRRSGRPLQNALIGLDWIRAGGQLLNIYGSDTDSFTDRVRILRGGSSPPPRPLRNLFTTTDEAGVFVLSFQWSGTDLGTAIDNPRCQIFVLVEEPTGNVVTARLYGRYVANMITSVSLSQASGGLIPNPTQLGDQIGIGVDIFTVLRRIRRPMIGVTIAPPSPDMYALIAGYRIDL